MKHSFTIIFFLTCLNISTAQYYTFPSYHNEINQVITKTSDDGFLITAYEFCYTPDEWVIEGCPVGIHLIKTNTAGDTLWENEIVNHSVQGFLHVFENRDKSISIFTGQNATFNCKEWIIEPPFGLLQILTYHLTPEGELISQSSFPDDCNLQLLAAQQIVDTSFAVLARYNEPFASDTNEGHLYILDQKGSIIRSHVLPGEYMHKADIMIDTQKNILLFFVDHDSVPHLQVFDQELDLLQNFVNTQINSECLYAEHTRGSAELSDSGSIVIVCDDPFGKNENLEILVFDKNLQLLAQEQYTIPLASDFAINDDQELMVLSQVSTEEDSSDIKLTYFNISADSLLTRHFRIPGNQTPNDLLPLDGENFAISGGHNCCNLSASVGPGKTFLYLAELSSATTDMGYKENQLMVYPNPSNDFISIELPGLSNASDKYSIALYTSIGQKVFESEIISGMTIPIHHLNEGMYYVILKSPDGRFTRNSFIKIRS